MEFFEEIISRILQGREIVEDCIVFFYFLFFIAFVTIVILLDLTDKVADWGH